MSWMQVKDALKAPVGSVITVKGWVRTRRDSKADGGLSFIAVSRRLLLRRHPDRRRRRHSPTTPTEVAKLTTGCAIEADGVIVEPQGKGQAVEIAGRPRVRVVGWVDDPDTLPHPAQAPHLRVPPRSRPPPRPAPTPSAPSPASATASPWRSTASSTSAASSTSTPRSSPPATAKAPAQMFRVTTLDLANAAAATDRTVSHRLHPGLLRQASPPHRLRPARRRDLRLRPGQRLHLRPDLPRRELQHHPPPRRVLDDRAGDRLRRPRRRRRPRRGVPQVPLQRPCSTERADDMEFFAERIDKTAIERARAHRRDARSAA